MTNEEELIAQARRGLTEEAKRLQELVDTLEQLAPLRPRRYGKREQQLLDAKHNLNIVTTHLAEMDEKEMRIAELDRAYTDPYLKKDLANIYREGLLTKAKRLLGATNDN